MQKSQQTARRGFKDTFPCVALCGVLILRDLRMDLTVAYTGIYPLPLCRKDGQLGYAQDSATSQGSALSPCPSSDTNRKSHNVACKESHIVISVGEPFQVLQVGTRQTWRRLHYSTVGHRRCELCIICVHRTPPSPSACKFAESIDRIQPKTIHTMEEPRTYMNMPRKHISNNHHASCSAVLKRMSNHAVH